MWYAPTPPLETFKFMLSLLSMQKNKEEMDRDIILLIDITKAYANAPTDRVIYVDLPPEEDVKGIKCGLLHKAMNGTRDGAKNWGDFFRPCNDYEVVIQFCTRKIEPMCFPLDGW